MKTPNTNVKKKGSTAEYKFAMPLETFAGEENYNNTKEVSAAVRARGKAALQLFSMGEW